MKRGSSCWWACVISPATSAALLRDAETGRPRRYLGWQVRGLTPVEVNAERAVLRLGAEFEELRLALQRVRGKTGAGMLPTYRRRHCLNRRRPRRLLRASSRQRFLFPTPAQLYSSGSRGARELPGRGRWCWCWWQRRRPGLRLAHLPVARADQLLAQTDRSVFEEVLRIIRSIQFGVTHRHGLCAFSVAVLPF